MAYYGGKDIEVPKTPKIIRFNRVIYVSLFYWLLATLINDNTTQL